MTCLTVGSLFSGVGAFDLGLERAGMRVIWQAEVEPYACAVLREHWPDVPNHGDVRSIRAGAVERPDVICGGFPCQDISVAGAGRGLAGERSGLWREVRRIVGDLRPRYVLVENVGALTGRGLATILGDFAALGYVGEWHVIPAAAVDAPHLRERCWIIACDASDADRCNERRRLEQEWRSDQRDAESAGDGAQGPPANTNGGALRHTEQRQARDLCDGGSAVVGNDGSAGDAADPDRERRERCGIEEHAELGGTSGCQPDGLGARGWRGGAQGAPHTAGERAQGHGADRLEIAFAPRLARLLGRDDARAHWREWTAIAPIRGMDDGASRRMDRNRLRCLGNALLPQIAEAIGLAVMEHAA